MKKNQTGKFLKLVSKREELANQLPQGEGGALGTFIRDFFLLRKD